LRRVLKPLDLGNRFLITPGPHGVYYNLGGKGPIGREVPKIIPLNLLKERILKAI